MQSTTQPVLKDIVLVGGGHSHVGVLRSFGMRPMPGVRLTLIGTDTHTPYSGMLPGYVAGHYGFDDVHLDLRRLAVFAGGRFFNDEVIGLDREARLVLCRNRPPVPYDLLSINTGSTPRTEGVPGATEHVVPVKPIRQFDERWRALLERVRHSEAPLRVAVVGAGAGGVELLLSMQHRMQRERALQGKARVSLSFDLFDTAPDVMPTHNRRVRHMMRAHLQARGVRLHLGARVQEVSAKGVRVDGEWIGPFDEIVWATQAGGPAWLAGTGLALDARGFVKVRDTLQTVDDPLIFAAGDVAAWEGRALEKAGVFAVRMGRPLADNLRNALQGQPLARYQPQRHWLALMGTGDEYAVASRGRWGLQGAWVWHWKRWIDQRFMRRFSELTPSMVQQTVAANHPDLALSDEEARQALAAQAMRCGGCGAKVGSSVLSRALAAIHVLPQPGVLVGLDSPDDAAVVRVPPGQLLVQTVDFFRAFIDDPYVFGRIAANHALGDVYAMGAAPHTCTAVATIPPGLESKVEDTVRQLMSGAVKVLNAAGCALVGGHTGEGQELALGFAIQGLMPDQPSGRGPLVAGTAMTKGGMRLGERLILTKPIGTGVIMAAHARMASKGRWVDAALESMQQSNRDAALCLREHGASACTDVTGFGLLGHALEMARASGTGLALALDAVPLLDGAQVLARAGVLSSLQPANLRLRRAIVNHDEAKAHPVYPLLFDPQTAGGLLASVPAERVPACLAALRALGYAQACMIGEVLPLGLGDGTETPVRLLY